MTDIKNSSHRRLFGIAAAIAAGICLATGGVGLRWVEAATGWQVLVYRGGALALVIGLWTLFQYRGGTLCAYRRIGVSAYWRARCGRLIRHRRDRRVLRFRYPEYICCQHSGHIELESAGFCGTSVGRIA